VSLFLTTTTYSFSSTHPPNNQNLDNNNATLKFNTSSDPTRPTHDESPHSAQRVREANIARR